MDTGSAKEHSSHQVGRRQAMQVLGAGAAAAGLAACTDTSGEGSGRQVPTGDVKFDLPAPKRALPTKHLQLRWMDSGDQKAYFFKPFFSAYHKKHSNISINYDGSNWTQIQQVITTGVRNGTEPDVFQLPGTITIPVAVANGWIGAFDDIVPDFSAVRKSYPPGVFANGVTDFNGKSYAVPLVTGQRLNNLLVFNTDHMKKADADLNQVINWDDFRALLKKITKQGAGKYYGMVMGLASANHLSDPISTLAQMAGLRGGMGIGTNLGIDWRTGEFNFTHPIAQAAVELFLAINSDGSLLPGSTSLDDAGARNRMPQGVAGVMFDGPWDISIWAADNPDFHLGLNVPPQANPKQIWPMTYPPSGNGKWVYKTKSPARAVIGDIFSYLTSEDAQVHWTQLDLAADPPPKPNAIKKAKLNALEEKSIQLAQRYMVLAPEPAVRNPDVAKVYEQLKTPEPDFSDVCVGLLTGQISGGVKRALQGLQDRYNALLDDTIKVVNKRGAKVSREDWVFKDWDPQKPYAKLYKS